MNEAIKTRLAYFNTVLTALPLLRYVGDPILRTQTQATDSVEGKQIADQLAKALLEYRKITGFGRGLAAPQIGINKSIFITFVDDIIQVFINPTIVEKSEGTNFYKELCLSSGIMAADVERPEWIVMEWTDVEGKPHKRKFESFLARLYQHEEAHLRGKVNLDEATAEGIEFITFDPLKEQLRKTR